MYQVAPKHFALAFGASLLAGALGAVAVEVAGAFWFWVLLYAPAIGPVLGRLISKITGGKRGAKVAFVVSLGLICGALVGAWGTAAVELSRIGAPALLLALIFANFPLLIFLFLAIGGVWWWLK